MSRDRQLVLACAAVVGIVVMLTGGALAQAHPRAAFLAGVWGGLLAAVIAYETGKRVRQ